MVYADFGNNVKTTHSTEKGVFSNKNIQKTLNTFGRKKDIYGGKCALEYFNELSKEYLKNNFSSDVIAKMPKFTMTYSYLTTNNRLHSDADEVTKTMQGTLHSWEINENNFNREIQFGIYLPLQQLLCLLQYI